MNHSLLTQRNSLHDCVIACLALEYEYSNFTMMKIMVPVYGCSDCFAWLFAWFLTCLFLDDNGIVFLCIVCMFDLHMITLSCICLMAFVFLAFLMSHFCIFMYLIFWGFKYSCLNKRAQHLTWILQLCI